MIFINAGREIGSNMEEKQIRTFIDIFIEDHLEDDRTKHEPLFRLCEKVYEIGFALGWCDGLDDFARFLSLPQDKQDEVAEKFRGIIKDSL